MVAVAGERVRTWLWSQYLWRYMWPLGIAAGLAVSGTVLDLARPWPLLLVVDHGIGHRPLAQPWSSLLSPVGDDPVGLAVLAGLALICLAVAGGVVNYLAVYLAHASVERMGADLRGEVQARLLGLSMRFHERQRAGELTTRLSSDVSRVQDLVVASVVSVLPNAVPVVGVVVVLLAIDPLMGLVSLLVAIAAAAVIVGGRLRLGQAQLKHRRQQGALAAGITEAMRNVGLVQALAHEHSTLRAFRSRNLELADSGQELGELGAGNGPAAEIVLGVGIALVLWIGTAQVMSGHMTVGLLFVVLWYMAALSSPIRSLARLTTILGNAAASGDRLNEVLSSRETVPETSEAPVLPTPRQHIVFRDVSFSYIPGRPVLREVDLEIKTGSTLCIVGPAGAGKSTLLSLLLRLYDPDSGSIEVDGADLRSFDLRSIRERFALVPDEPSIFDGSILDNIAMGRPGASRADLHEAARSSLVASFADRLPGGLGARVGEGGVMLSGGQRRRLAMARALVRQAPVLLLDEPTSGLDVEAEAQIMTEVRGASRTVVVVTSSIYLTQHADQVVVLNDGSVVEAGEPAQLRQGAGHYAHLCDRYLPQPEVRHASSEAAIDGQQPTPSTVC